MIDRFSGSRLFMHVLTVVPFLCALGLYVDWQHDNAILHRQSVEITKNSSTDSARIHIINDWVYHNRGFGTNEHYFIVPALGPTPVQVLESGGDCADKSRLVAAMLNELNIKAGLVMIAPCPRCGFIHTVVEAQHESGRMVADPVWNVDYPAPDGRYLGVSDLAGTRLGPQHVAVLQLERGATDKIRVMPSTEATIDYAAPVNWDKNLLSRTAARTLIFLGYDLDSMFRPRFLEDPKLAILLYCIGVGIAVIIGRLLFGFFGAIAGRRARRRVAGLGRKNVEPVGL